METGIRLSAEEMDEIRQKNIAYQYLCHLEEAKEWIEACIEEELPETENLEEEFRHGVYLAKLANFFSPEKISSKKIFDLNLTRYRSYGLHFRHTDNINYFLKALKAIQLPKIFYPETTDIYDKKNIPKAVFCIHALSLFLFRLGIAPQIQNLYGKIQFSDEVMASMMEELSKFGCQLPQFGKIGGILANELPVDEAALHAAVIAINDALHKQNLKELESTLLNPSCHLTNVIKENMEDYNYVLYKAQQEKKAVALNKSRESDYIPDAYDELLTQSEIQGYLKHTNVSNTLEKIEVALECGKREELWPRISSDVLNLKCLQQNLVSEYMIALKQELNNLKDCSINHSFNQSFMKCILSKAIIERVIKKVNEEAENQKIANKKLERLNHCLEQSSYKDTLLALHAMHSNLGVIFDYAAPLYHEEMADIKLESQADLTMDEVVGGVQFLTAIGHINAALDTGRTSEVWQYLCAPDAHVKNLDKSYAEVYALQLAVCKESLHRLQNSCPLLTYIDIQETVHRVNEEKRRDNSKIAAITTLNEAVRRANSHLLLDALHNLALNVNGLTTENVTHCLHLLQQLKSAKCQMMQVDDLELWLEDVFDVMKVLVEHEEEAQTVAGFLSAVHVAACTGNLNKIEEFIGAFNFTASHIRKDLVRKVSEKIVERYRSRIGQSELKHAWVTATLHDGSQVYVDIKSGKFSWNSPYEENTDTPDASPLPSCFSLDELNEIAKSTVEEVAVNKKIETGVIHLQAICRGYLVRNKIKALTASVIMIQSWWRMIMVRRSYNMYRNALLLWEPKIIKIQRAFRAWRKRRAITNVTEQFKGMEHKVVLIQRAWRQYKARMDLRALTQCKNPPLSVIRKFVYLLQVSHFDFEEELRLQRVKSDVVKTIRRISTLENQIDELDVKIGLLVHNRITLQDVIKHVPDKENMNPNLSHTDTSSKKHRRSTKDIEKCATLRTQRGLKALKRESRERLVGYQHLFYLLQTQPHYLASLIFALPIGKTTNFLENVIFTLYNYGSNDRDNYLLLKLMKTALEEEIRSKVFRLSDIVSGNPLVVKMIVSFNRKGAGQSSLRDMLAPLVNQVLNDPGIQINTNPVEIYKTWVNQLEMSSGQPSGLPYVVNQEQAMQYTEVQKRLLKAITSLRDAAAIFCTHITSSRHLIPYAIQYMGKVMKAALHKRFPHIPEKDILKVVGNLIYYRFINSAIVAPDAFDIIPISPDKKLTNEQRRNLASIAKVLQFAASKKGFGEESSHLMGLNSFIVDCHEEFKAFFMECCLVDEPETVYSVNQYSEATIIIKPTIYINLQEIVQTHQLLLDHEVVIAPNPNDPLHELLHDLGERPTIFKLIGEPDEMDNANTACAVGRMEVCLALSSKFDLQESKEESKEGKDSNEKLFVKTKQLLVDIMQCIDGDVIHDLTTGPTLPQQNSKYQALTTTRAEHHHKAKMNDTDLNRSNSFLGNSRVSLSEVKTKLQYSLRRLENRNLSSRNDNYQTLLNAIAKDIVNQRQRRVDRRNELQKLVLTAKKLGDKEEFYNEQLKSYNKYLDTCLINLASRNKNVHHQALFNKASKNSNKAKLTLKYTGARLHERGVVLEIEDLPPAQLKNVLFEITPLATSGLFQVQVKFMGVAMEVVQVDIQNLLQLQYEGVSVKTMFGKAKVNVNLLLHFLNTKFYSKKK